MIIGFGYQQKVGKDHAARVLCEQAGFRRYGFTDPLYRMAFAATGLDPDLSVDLDGREAFKVSVHRATVGAGGYMEATGREILQWLGTEVGRAAEPDLWAMLLARKLGEVLPHTDVVISDVRFSNEVTMLRDLGATFGAETKLVRIASAATQGAGSNHQSDTEGASIAWDVEIFNDFSDKFDRDVLRLLE